MVNILLKIVNLFNLIKSKNNSNRFDLNEFDNISPDKSKNRLINCKKYCLKVILVLILGISHGFMIGFIRLILVN